MRTHPARGAERWAAPPAGGRRDAVAIVYAASAEPTPRSSAEPLPALRVVPVMTLVSVTALSLLTVVTRARLGQYYPVAVNADLCAVTFSLLTVRSRLDLTAPHVWVNSVLTLLFVAHPLAVLATHQLDQPYQNQFDLRATYGRAIELGGLATLGINVPLILDRLRPARARHLRAAWNLSGRRADQVSLVCLVLAATSTFDLWWTGFYGEAATGSGGVGRTAYLYLLPSLVVPALVLMVVANASDRRPWRTRLFWLTAIVAAGLTAYVGQRTSLVFIVAAPGLTWALLHRRRANRLVAVGLAFSAFFLFGALRDTNAQGMTFTSAVVAALDDPRGIVLRSFTGNDTEMVDALALEVAVVPVDIPFRHGIIVESTLAAPVPRAIWPNKVPSADVVLNSYLLGRGAGSASIAYSFVGEGYLDDGPAGVLLVSAGFGVVFAGADRLRRRDAGTDYSARAAVLASATALAPTVLRGIIAYSLAHVLFVFTPVLVAIFLTGRNPRPDPEARLR